MLFRIGRPAGRSESCSHQRARQKSLSDSAQSDGTTGVPLLDTECSRSYVPQSVDDAEQSVAKASAGRDYFPRSASACGRIEGERRPPLSGGEDEQNRKETACCVLTMGCLPWLHRVTSSLRFRVGHRNVPSPNAGRGLTKRQPALCKDIRPGRAASASRLCGAGWYPGSSCASGCSWASLPPVRPDRYTRWRGRGSSRWEA